MHTPPSIVVPPRHHDVGLLPRLRRRALYQAALIACAGVAQACADTAADAPTAPVLVRANAVASTSSALAREPVDFSGYWHVNFFYVGQLESTDPLANGRFECGEDTRPAEYMEVHLEQDGARVVGTGSGNGAFTCSSLMSRKWYITMDEAFDGRVHAEEIRFSLNQNMDVRATLDATGNTMTGTERLRIDPAPYAKPFFVEATISFIQNPNKSR
jgi:hypothetical protein